MRISDWSSDVCSSDLLPAATTSARRCARSSPCRSRWSPDTKPLPNPWTSLKAQEKSLIMDAVVEQTKPAGALDPITLEVDRKRVVQGKSVSVRVSPGGRRVIKNTKIKARDENE